MRTLTGLAALGATVLTSLVAAYGQTTNVGNLYFGVNAGAIIPESISTHQVEPALGTTVTLNDRFRFSAGPTASLLAGYHISDLIAVEADLQYAGADFTTPTVVVTFPFLGGTGGTIIPSSKGHVDIFTTLIETVFTPLGRSGWMGLSPFIGGGIGFSYWHDDIDFTGLPHFSENEVNLAADAIVGVDYAVTTQISVGARYQFLWTRVSNEALGLGSTGSNSDFHGHSLTANATFHF